MLTLEVNNGEFIFHGRSMQITKEKNALLAPYGKILFSYGKVLRLLPTEVETQNINQQIGNARFVRNSYLNERNKIYETSKTTLTVADYKKNYLPKLKEDNPFLYLSDKFALESAVERVDDAYNHFFDNLKNGRKAGFPKMASKFKPNGNSYTTKFTNNNIGLYIIDGLPYIKLPKLGKMRFVLPVGETIDSIFPRGTKITSATIRRSNDIYTVSLQLEQIIDKPENLLEIHKTDVYAMDMGIKDFGIYGNCEFTEKELNPRWIKIHEKRLRRYQKSLSRKVKGSKNYEKAKVKITHEHRKIKNQRRDFHHKLSRKIVNECKVFICEDLNIKGMVKNRHLSKEISSVGWGQFLNFVKYKLERKGGIFVQVGRFYASSKTCSHCGHKNDELTLKDRYWTCPQCGTHLDRDENAKDNMIEEGIRILETDHNILVIA